MSNSFIKHAHSVMSLLSECLFVVYTLCSSLNWPSDWSSLCVLWICCVFLRTCILTNCLRANIYIRPLSSVQNKLRFFLHELYDLSWPLSGRSLGKNMYHCALSIYLKKIKSTTLSNLVFSLGWLIRCLSYIIIVPTFKIELDYIRNWNMRR